MNMMKTNIMFLMNVSKNKWAGVSNRTVWTDEYFTPKAADNADVSSVVVCCSK